MTSELRCAPHASRSLPLPTLLTSHCRYGASRCLLLFALCLAAGQAIFAFGVSISSLPVLLLGRVVFALGGENCTVGISTLLASWFRGKEMACAMGELSVVSCKGKEMACAMGELSVVSCTSLRPFWGRGMPPPPAVSIATAADASRVRTRVRIRPSHAPHTPLTRPRPPADDRAPRVCDQ